MHRYGDRTSPRQVHPATLDDDEDDRWPVLPVIEVVDRRNAPPLTSSDEIEIEPLPNSQAPEAPPDPQRAPPDIEDEPETEDGGESRRARSGFRGALENQFLPWTNRQLNPSDLATLVPAMKDALSRGRAARDTVGVLRGRTSLVS